MNYSEIINALDKASGFDLFRIQSAIGKMLEDPKRVVELKQRLSVDQAVEYFEPDENRIIKATVLKIKRTKILVKNNHDQRNWELPYYYINIHGIDTNIIGSGNKQGLDRNEVKVGDKVCFMDNDNKEHYGDVVRLNPKTVTLNCQGSKWRVHYGGLFKVLAPDIDVLPYNKT